MKRKHLSIIIAAGTTIAGFVTIAILFPTMFQFNPDSDMDAARSQLALAVSINSTEIKVGQTMGMDISLANMSPNTLVVKPQQNWPMKQWSMGPCLFHLPFGMALFRGNYVIKNMTEGQRLSLYPSGVYMCNTIGIVDYVFDPSSTKAIVETNNSTNYPVTMEYHVAFNGFYDGQKFQLLTPGVYTVVGDDQWAHVMINHFTVKG